MSSNNRNSYKISEYKQNTGQKPDALASPSEAYDLSFDNWQIVTDLLNGTLAMRRAATQYLPKEPAEKRVSYNARLARSFLYNGLKGAITKVVAYPFSKKITLPESKAIKGSEILSALEEDVNGKGTSLTEFSREFFESMIALGHCGIFINFTDVNSVKTENVSKKDEEDMGAGPNWNIVKACDIIGWEFGSDGKLIELRWREVKVEKQKGKKWLTQEVQYINYWTRDSWEIWKHDPGTEDNQSSNYRETVLGNYLGTCPIDWQASFIEGFKKTSSGKNTLGEIPFVIAYTNKVTDFISEPPFIELGWTNIEHWQSNSDQKNILRFARLAQKVLSGSSGKDGEADNLIASVNNVIRLKAADARMYYLEHSGKGIEAGAADLRGLEDKMKGQGLQPLFQRTQEATATGSMVSLMNVTTDAQAWIASAQQALKEAYQWSAKWEQVDLEKEFTPKIYKDFNIPVQGGADFQHVQSLADAGSITELTLLTEAQRRGILSDSIDLEKELEKARSEMALIVEKIVDEADDEEKLDEDGDPTDPDKDEDIDDIDTDEIDDDKDDE